MKSLIFILTINSLICLGQDFFIDNLKSSDWTSDEQFEIKKIESKKEIQLSKLKIPKDSLKASVTIWTFESQNVILRHYDAKLKTETQIMSCIYNYDHGNGLLKIRIDNNELAFKVAVVSTGSFILLTRRKIKEKA